MKTNATLTDLKQYIKRGGSKNLIAEAMGYTSAQTIDKWIVRRRIPRWAQKRLWEIITKEQSNELKN